MPHERGNALHYYISSGDYKAIETFLIDHKENEDEKFYNDEWESAAAIAIKSGKLQIYELLLSKNISLGSDEMIDDLLGNYSDGMKRKLRDIHRKYFIDPNLKHHKILISKSKLGHETSVTDRQPYLDKIVKVFEELNSLKWVEPILKIASTSEKLEIVFDFNHDSVEHARASDYGDSNILVAAKGLFKDVYDEEYSQALGALSHEMCHFAMFLLYNNKCKPYKDGDIEKMNIFEAIVKKMREKTEDYDEETISTAYSEYPDDKHQAELIVRVPHLAAVYKDDDYKFTEVREKFEELFSFYEENTLIDLQNGFQRMAARNEIRELNECFRTLATLETSAIELSSSGLNINLSANDKFLFISSNCTQITMCAIYQQVKNNENFKSRYVFADLKTIKNKKVFNFTAKTLKLCTDPILIIDCDSLRNVDEANEIVQMFSSNGIGERIVFVHDKNTGQVNISSIHIEHTWNHLASNFQQKLLQRKIYFQGFEMKLEDLLQDLKSIVSVPFNDLLGDMIFDVGKELCQLDFEDCIERKFLDYGFRPKIERSTRVRRPVLDILVRDVNPGYMESVEDCDIEYDFNAVLGFAANDLMILLSDEPGMGKSTAMKMMESTLKKKYLESWIVFMDLKKCCGAFQEVNKVTITFKTQKEVIKFFCVKILKLNSFDSQIFEQLFKEHRVIILMDGVDEICPRFEKFVFSLMNVIQVSSKNQFFLSSRPNMQQKIEKKLKSKVLMLKPFTTSDRSLFFHKIFIAKGMTVEKSNEMLDRVEEFIIQLEASINNPLQLKMLADCFGSNSNFDSSASSLFKIYDEFTAKMVERTMQKGSEVEASLANVHRTPNLEEFYEINAFRICFVENEINKSRLNPNSSDEDDSEDDDLLLPTTKKMMKKCFKNVLVPSSDDITRVGLMFKDDSKTLHFIHKTFAEFYAAKYFYKIIFLRNFRSSIELQKTMKVFYLVFDRLEAPSTFSMIRTFIDNALGSFEDILSHENPIFDWNDRISDICRSSLELGHFNIFKILSIYFHPSPIQHLLTKDEKNRNILMFGLRYHSISFNERLYNLLEKIVGSDGIKKMCLQIDHKDRNVFHFATLNEKCSEGFGFLFNKVKMLISDDTLKNLLKQKKRNNIIHAAMPNSELLQNVLNILSQEFHSTELQSFLKRNKCGDNLFHIALKERDDTDNHLARFEALWVFIKVLDKKTLQSVLMQRDKAKNIPLSIAINLHESKIVMHKVIHVYFTFFGELKMRKILLKLIYYIMKSELLKDSLHTPQIIKILNLLLEISPDKTWFKNMFESRNTNDETLLLFAVKKFTVNDLFKLWAMISSVLNVDEQRKILRQTDKFNKCALQCTGNDTQKFVFLKNLFIEKFDKREIAEIITCGGQKLFVDFIVSGFRTFVPLDNSEISRRSNPYLLQIETEIKKFVIYIDDLIQEPDIKEKFRNLFLTFDDNNETIFMNVVKSGTAQDLYNINLLSKKLFDQESLKLVLLKTDKTGGTAFHKTFYYTRSSFDDRKLNLVKQIYLETFGQEKMREIVLADMEGGKIMSYCIRNFMLEDHLESLRVLKRFCAYLKEFQFNLEIHNPTDGLSNLIKNSIETLNGNDTPLMLVARECKSDAFSTLMSLLQVLKNDEQREILLETNKRGECAFHCAAQNENHVTLLMAMHWYRNKFDDITMREIVLRFGQDFIENITEKTCNSHEDSYEFPANIDEFYNYIAQLLKNLVEESIFKGFFICFDEYDETIFMSTARLKSKEHFENLCKLSKLFFGKKSFNEILLRKNRHGETAFHSSIFNTSSETFLYVSQIYLEILRPEEMEQFLMETVCRNKILGYTLKYSGANNETFSLFCNFLSESFRECSVERRNENKKGKGVFIAWNIKRKKLKKMKKRIRKDLVNTRNSDLYRSKILNSGHSNFACNALLALYDCTVRSKRPKSATNRKTSIDRNFFTIFDFLYIR